jgi:hypothetical protein
MTRVRQSRVFNCNVFYLNSVLFQLTKKLSDSQILCYPFEIGSPKGLVSLRALVSHQPGGFTHPLQCGGHSLGAGLVLIFPILLMNIKGARAPNLMIVRYEEDRFSITHCN